MIKRIIIIVFCLPLGLLAQIGGTTAFSFMDVELSPRIEAMGGSGIAIVDYDVTLAQTTPSLLNAEMHNSLVFSFTDYFSDINLIGFSYARKWKEFGIVSLGIKAVNYGNFDHNDAVGNNLGSFSAHDQVITLGASRSLNEKFTLGVNINVLNSQYETYHAFALAANIATTYFNPEKAFTATFLLKNIGRQLVSYTDKKETLPFDAQLGMSKELKHLPFRYSLTFHHLNQFDIKSPYKLISQTNIETGELEIKEESIAKTALRHLIIGGELNPFRKSLFIRGGFNFQRRFDMSLSTYPALVGFSWGIGFKVSKFRLDYSRASYHLSGTPNNFSIATNLSTFGL
ncbi:MAG: type IX secretion system protein PorQ [Flavobacteriales bacterium]|nr:type IX secretion system protein PorQ [Flavobacteriales bacterium]